VKAKEKQAKGKAKRKAKRGTHKLKPSKENKRTANKNKG